MSDIFISYKREEEPIARKLADALETEGWSVWWDPKLRAGEHFDDVIEKALNEAKCVIVMWSERSVQSRYVRDEATYGLEKNKLVPVAIENVNLPFRFRGVQTTSLLGWDGSNDFLEFRKLVEDISTILGPTGRAEAEEHSKLDEVRLRKQGLSDDDSKRQDEEEGRRNIAQKYSWRTYGPVAAAVAGVLVLFSFVFWPQPQGSFLNRMSALILGNNAGLRTLISLTVGLLLLLAVCLYYARFWHPERKDQGQSAFWPMSHERVHAQPKKERHRKWIRRLAIAGLILIPILSFSSVAGWFYVQSLPAKKIIVLVADFDGPDETYGVTQKVTNQLRQATKKYDDIEIQGLKKPITQQEGSKVAQAEGEKRKATIVIWGWYRTPGEVVPLSVHFEVLQPPKALPELGQAATGSVQQAATAELRSFTLQTRLSEEMTYLSLFVLGMARRSAGDGEGAIARFNDALGQTTEPSSSLNQSLVYFFRGLTYLAKDNFDHALADLNQAIKLQPTFALAYVNRGVIYIGKGDWSQSLADLNQALQLKPDLAEAYNNRGLFYLHSKNYDQAIADFSHALKLLVNTSDSSKAIRLDGSQLGTFSRDRDIPFFTVVTEFSDYLVYINRGAAYLSKSDHNRALTDFTDAIKLRPKQVIAYINRAAVYYMKQDYDRALADLNRTIKLQPDFALAYMKRGVIYDSKGDFDHAVADLNQAIRLQPNSAFFYSIRGELYVDRDDHEGAIADFSEAIKLQPDFIEAYLGRAGSYRKKGDDDSALADYNQALQLAPDNAEAYNRRGWTYAQKGDFDRALDDLNQALKLKPGEAAIYDTRGLAYAGKGDYDRAMADYNQALKLKPDADYAYYDRGVVYRALGDHQKAIADFKRTLELTKNSKRRQDAEKQLRELGAKSLKK